MKERKWPQFSLRTSLLIMGGCSVSLALVIGLNRSRSVDPTSGRFVVDGSERSIYETTLDGKPVIGSGLKCSPVDFTSINGYQGSSDIQLEQVLCGAKYENYFGQSAFGWELVVNVAASEDFSDYSLWLTPIGGGNVDANTMFYPEFDPETMSLVVQIQTSFRMMRVRKRMTLAYKYSSGRFVLEN